MVKKKTARKSSKTRRDSFTLPDEEMAFRMVKLYFEEVARLGFKRTLDLDAIINAYFYSLARLKRKDKEMKLIEDKVLSEEAELAKENKEDLFPNPEAGL